MGIIANKLGATDHPGNGVAADDEQQEGSHQPGARCQQLPTQRHKPTEGKREGDKEDTAENPILEEIGRAHV